MSKSINITLKKGFLLDEENTPSEKISVEKLVFKGDLNNPFLAPRGVFIFEDKLIVADTGQNRVFIWHQLPTSTYQSPDLVLGQTEKEQTARNKGTSCSSDSLMYPSGIWTNGKLLIIADAWNHRVLIWHQFPTKNGQNADVVIGQPDFTHHLPNVKGVGKEPNAQSLNWPYGVFSDGNKLWIADTGNRRILVFNEIPTKNFTQANHVFGAKSFTNRDYDHQNAVWPYAVKLSKQGKVAVCDTQYFRVLLWENHANALQNIPTTIIGQKDLESNGANQFELFPRSNTLNWVYDCTFYKNGLFISDTGNSRILWFSNVPNASNTTATNLIGKDNFNIGSEFTDTLKNTENSIYWPFSIATCETRQLMAIADTGNHRILLHQLLI